MQTFVVTAAAVALLSGAAGLAQWRDSHVALAAPADNSLCPHVRHRGAPQSAGYSTLAADLYWIRAAHLGGERLKAVQRAQGSRPSPPTTTPSSTHCST